MVTKTEEGLYEVEVQGSKYQFEKWGAEEALDTLLEMVPIVGRPLGTALGAIVGKDKKNIADKEIDPELVGLMIDALTVNFNKGAVKTLIKKLCSEKVLCDGKKIIFNTHYQDKLDVIFLVVGAALEVQYGNFFGALLGLFGTKSSPKMGLQNRSLPT
jgi:hypothetical protein